MASNKSQSNITERATSHLRRLARNRRSRIVTADDVQNFLDRNNFRGSQNERLSITRQVLNKTNFVAIPQVGFRSTRPQARGRTITPWTLSSN